VANEQYVESPLRVTPIAEMKHLYLFRQDTKFDPKYGTNFIFDPKKNKEHASYLKALKELNDKVGEELLKGIQKGRNAFKIKDIVTPEEDAEGNPTGRYILKVTTKEKPTVKDALGNIIPDSVGQKIGNGSMGRAILSLKKSVVTTRKTVGITFYLSKVQVTEVKEYTSTGSDFSPVEGGFTTDADSKEAADECPF